MVVASIVRQRMDEGTLKVDAERGRVYTRYDRYARLGPWKRMYEQNRHGYLLVWVQFHGRREYRLVHRLVWESKYGPIPLGMDVHHVDRDRSNNSIYNLTLVPHDDHPLSDEEFEEWWNS